MTYPIFNLFGRGKNGCMFRTFHGGLHSVYLYRKFWKEKFNCLTGTKSNRVSKIPRDHRSCFGPNLRYKADDIRVTPEQLASSEERNSMVREAEENCVSCAWVGTRMSPWLELSLFKLFGSKSFTHLMALSVVVQTLWGTMCTSR